jgi:hypothetical protein
MDQDGGAMAQTRVLGQRRHSIGDLLRGAQLRDGLCVPGRRCIVLNVRALPKGGCASL